MMKHGSDGVPPVAGSMDQHRNMGAPVLIRQLERRDMEAAAAVHRASFDDRLLWLAGLHTPDEDRAFFTDVVFAGSEVWGAFEGAALVGFIAFREGHIDHLYVLPANQRRGVGSRLLALAQDRCSALSLWTFQRNDPARRFYERRGFVAVEQTDGALNEEREPDIRYIWSAQARQTAPLGASTPMGPGS